MRVAGTVSRSLSKIDNHLGAHVCSRPYRCMWDVCVVPDDLPSLPQVHLRLEEQVTLAENNKVDWSITKASAK